VLGRDAEIGRRHGLKYAEQFHYIGPPKNEVGEYIRTHRVPSR
jgi:hypothetical protein